MSNKLKKDSLGDRMKTFYEDRNKTYLTRRTPVIIRVDGKAFHTFTIGLKKPFDEILTKTMQQTAKYLVENIQGCKLAYTQSDEISLLLTDYNTLTTNAWFDYSVQKMCSISASMATLAFNVAFQQIVDNYIATSTEPTDKQYIEMLKSKFNKAMFDSRCFNLPKEEVCNYFIWRQQDAIRNAVSMAGHANFSNKQLYKKNKEEIIQMLLQDKGINFEKFHLQNRRGSCVQRSIISMSKEQTLENFTRVRLTVNEEIPIFSEDRDYIERHL